MTASQRRQRAVSPGRTVRQRCARPQSSQTTRESSSRLIRFQAQGARSGATPRPGAGARGDYHGDENAGGEPRRAVSVTPCATPPGRGAAGTAAGLRRRGGALSSRLGAAMRGARSTAPLTVGVEHARAAQRRRGAATRPAGLDARSRASVRSSTVPHVRRRDAPGPELSAAASARRLAARSRDGARRQRGSSSISASARN